MVNCLTTILPKSAERREPPAHTRRKKAQLQNSVGRVIDIIAVAGDSLALQDLVDALAGIPGYLDAAKVINLLKYPMCVGPSRDSLLRSLETRTGRAFGGNVWRLVEQASDLGLAPDALVAAPTRL